MWKTFDPEKDWLFEGSFSLWGEGCQFDPSFIIALNMESWLLLFGIFIY